MLKENILWYRAIDPMSGRFERRLTFGGALLAVIGMVAVLIALVLIVSSLLTEWGVRV